MAEFGLWGRAPIPDTREIAEKGLRRNQADFAMIIDLDLSARIVETIGPHAPRPKNDPKESAAS